MSRMPVRRPGVVVRDVGDEVLLYDQRTDAAHALDKNTSGVWNSCQPHETVQSTAAALGLTEREIRASLAALSDAGVLAGDHTRRRVVQGAGVAGGAVLLWTFAAPSAMAATSGGSTTLTGVVYEEPDNSVDQPTSGSVVGSFSVTSATSAPATGDPISYTYTLTGATTGAGDYALDYRDSSGLDPFTVDSAGKGTASGTLSYQGYVQFDSYPSATYNDGDPLQVSQRVVF